MKKLLLAFMVAGSLAACNNDTNTTGNEDPVDSLQERKDTLLENVDSTADAKIDSIKERSEKLKERFDSTYDKKIDSAKGNEKK